jgi:broad specificity phosphatase PhoE
MIYLARHGETAWNLIGRRQGHLDSPLTERGVAQARTLGRCLHELLNGGVAHIASSPLGRAMATATIIAEHLGIDKESIVAEPLLTEHHMGRWQGLSNAQIDERFPGARQERAENKWEYVIPGGESYAKVHERAIAWLATVPEEQLLIAVAHEMLSRTIQGAYRQLDPHTMLALNHPHHVIYLLDKGQIEEIVCDQTSTD